MAVINLNLDPESLALVERLERLADRLEALIPKTEGAPVDVTQSHDPFAPEGPQADPQPVSDPEPIAPEGSDVAPEVEHTEAQGAPVEVPGTIGHMKGVPGPAVNAETGEVTPPGEPLPEVPAAPDPLKPAADPTSPVESAGPTEDPAPDPTQPSTESPTVTESPSTSEEVQ